MKISFNIVSTPVYKTKANITFHIKFKSLVNVIPSHFKHLDNAIANSLDDEFSWSVVDKMLDGFKKIPDWRRSKPIFDFLVKYVDVPRIERMHDIMKDRCVKQVQVGNSKLAEEMFASVRNIFIEEVKDHSVDLINAYANALLNHSDFDIAVKYFEQLAGVKNSSEAYFNLLACRLKTNDVTKVKLKLPTKKEDDGRAKKISELNIDEIIERIVICDTRERAARVRGMQYKLYMPSYRVAVRGGSTPTAIIAAIRSATGYNLNEAKNFIAKYRITDIHPTWIEANEVLEVLQSVGVDVDKIERVRQSGPDGLIPATKDQIISALQYELGCDFDEASKHVTNKNLFSKVYASKEEISFVIEKLREAGVHDVEIMEDDPNKGIDLNAPTETYTKLCKMLMFQVYHNRKNVHTLMEIFVSCYRHLDDKKQLLDTIFHVAEAFGFVKDFKQASIWYNELLIVDDTDARAHWGMLKCRLKAQSDFAVAKHRKKLMSMQEFNNAINCADNEQHKRFMAVYYNEVSKPDKKAMNLY